MTIAADIHIGPANPRDLEAVLALLERVNLPTAGLAECAAHVLAATQRGILIGCAALEVYDDGALLRSVAVAPAARHTGLGVALTQAALERARVLEVPAVYLLTETAERFFPRFGFRSTTRDAVPASVQTSVEFTSACPASAHVMVLHLGQHNAGRKEGA